MLSNSSPSTIGDILGGQPFHVACVAMDAQAIEPSEANDSHCNQVREVRILPWIRERAIERQRLFQQTRLIQLFGTEFSPHLEEVCISDSLCKIVVVHRIPSTLVEWSQNANSIDRVKLARRLTEIFKAAHRVGLIHGLLTSASIRVGLPDRCEIDFLERFNRPIEDELDVCAELDLAALGPIVAELLQPTLLDPTVVELLTGHRRAQYKSLLTRMRESAVELLTIEQLVLACEQLFGISPPVTAGDHPWLTSTPTPNLEVATPSRSSDVEADESDHTCEVVVEQSTPNDCNYLSDCIAGEIDIDATASQVTSLPKIGETLGRYRLDRLIGQGGMGSVFQGVDLSSNEVVAIKVLRLTGTDIAHAVRRFKKEARLLAGVQNDYVTRLYDVGVDRGHHYLAMEFVNGISLKEWLVTRSPLAEQSALQLIGNVARAIVDAHQQEIVHRDIKPENVLLGLPTTAAGGEMEAGHFDQLDQLRVKLSDFGIARHVNQSASMEVTRAGTMIGTPVYMSPEQCKGVESIGPASDIYSLGCTLYELLTGQPPFQAEDPMRLAAMHCFDIPRNVQKQNPQISEMTAALVSRMLAKDPTERFADAAQLVREIDRQINGEVGAFEAHPRTPECDSIRTWERVFEWDLQSHAGELWPLVSNTERLNRAAGLHSVVYRTERDPQLGLRKFGSFRLAGILIEWEEHPFEWVEGVRMGVLREFATGPFVWFLSIVELQPKPEGGTRLIHTVRIQPRHKIGRVLASVEAGWKGERALDRIYRRIDESLTHQSKNPFFDPFEKPEKNLTSLQKRIEQRQQAMLRRGSTLNATNALVEYIATAAPQSLAQIRPIELAALLNVDATEFIDACLIAASCGLLVLRWDILCPTCRAPASSATLLNEVDNHTACEACDFEFQSNRANALELVFQAHLEIREIDNKSYCIGGPEHSPHVVSQIRLEPGEKLELQVSLKVGDYLVRSRGLPTTQPLRIRSKSAPTQLDVQLSLLGTLSHTPALRAGCVTLCLTNDTPVLQVVRLERSIDRTNVLTAAMVSTLPRFRELFPEQVFKRDVPVATEDLTLLATTVINRRELCETLGETDAYLLIQQLLSVIEKSVVAQGGAVIKTVDERLLASFQRSENAVRCAFALADQLTELPELAALKLSSAIHQGRTLLATQNGRLDYFGTAPRLVQSLAEHRSQSIKLTDTIFSDPSIEHLLTASQRATRFETLELEDCPNQIIKSICIEVHER